MQTGTLHVLWGIGVALLLVGISLYQATGNSAYVIFVINGTLTSIWWMAQRGFSLGAQRFVSARTKIMLSLFLITAGSVAVSLSIVSSVLIGSVPLNTPFLLGGAFIFLLWTVTYILSLALAKPSAKLAP